MCSTISIDRGLTGAALVGILMIGLAPISFAADCEYRKAEGKEKIVGLCTMGPAGVAIEERTGQLKRITATVKEPSSPWAKAELNGKAALRYERDQCSASFATTDLSEVLDVKNLCGNGKLDSVSRPSFMTAGGAWVGKWYLGSPKVCKGQLGLTEGLILYSSTKVDDIERLCDIKKITQKGAGVELALRCVMEGNESNDVEYLEVISGSLKRTIIDGRKKQLLTYQRCP